MLRAAALCPLLAAAALWWMPAPARAAVTGEATARRVLLVVIPHERDAAQRLASIDGLSVAILSATEGSHTVEQPLLDVTAGARVAASAYPQPPPPLSLEAVGGGAVVTGWGSAMRRAQAAPQVLRPGLLASSVPGGAAFVATGRHPGIDGLLAADASGRVATLSLGPAGTLIDRIAAAESRRRLVVAQAPGGEQGIALLRALVAARSSGELIVALERPGAAVSRQLLWVAIAGMGARRTLTSASTDEEGLLSATDIAPTILSHMGVSPPPAMHGARIEAAGALDAGALSATMARLNAIGPRRMPALAWLLLATGAAAALAVLAGGRAGRARRGAWALRVAGLSLTWAPAATLLSAALEPGPAAEYALICGACLLLGVLSDATLRWPRALVAPALITLLAIVIDALAGTQLLMRSLLGPNPAFGARFHGIGNELKPVLAVLALAATAAALHPASRRHRAALAFALSGAALAAVEGLNEIGAGVGGVILVSAGAAVAVALTLPGALSGRRAAAAIATPLVALVALAGLDLATAGGGQLSVSVLHASSAKELWDIVVRRYSAAWTELGHGTIPYATALSVLACTVGVMRRRRLLAPLEGSGESAFAAALAGGLAAGVVGALVEDSGPVLLVLAAATLASVASYLLGAPRGPDSGDGASGGRAEAAAPRDVPSEQALSA